MKQETLQYFNLIIFLLDKNTTTAQITIFLILQLQRQVQNHKHGQALIIFFLNRKKPTQFNL